MIWTLKNTHSKSTVYIHSTSSFFFVWWKHMNISEIWPHTIFTVVSWRLPVYLCSQEVCQTCLEEIKISSWPSQLSVNDSCGFDNEISYRLHQGDFYAEFAERRDSQMGGNYHWQPWEVKLFGPQLWKGLADELNNDLVREGTPNNLEAVPMSHANSWPLGRRHERKDWVMGFKPSLYLCPTFQWSFQNPGMSENPYKLESCQTFIQVLHS